MIARLTIADNLQKGHVMRAFLVSREGLYSCLEHISAALRLFLYACNASAQHHRFRQWAPGLRIASVHNRNIANSIPFCSPHVNAATLCLCLSLESLSQFADLASQSKMAKMTIRLLRSTAIWHFDLCYADCASLPV